MAENILIIAIFIHIIMSIWICGSPDVFYQVKFIFIFILNILFYYFIILLFYYLILLFIHNLKSP